MSELGLGTAQLGLPYGLSNHMGQPSEDEAAAILASALNSGIRTIDTAPAYGESEELLGRLLPTGAAVRIVTKTVPLAGAEVSAADCDEVRRSAERSLERLRRDRLDGLLVHHGSNLALPGGERLAATLAELRDSGLVRRLGASVYDRAELDAARARLEPLDIVQLPLNAFDQRFLRDGTLEELQREGIEVHVRSAFLQGLLLMDPERLPSHLAAAEEPLRRYHEERLRAGIGPIEAALGLVEGAPGVDVTLVGTNSVAELEQCVTALRGRPSPSMDYAPLAVENPDLIDPRRWPA